MNYDKQGIYALRLCKCEFVAFRIFFFKRNPL